MVRLEINSNLLGSVVEEELDLELGERMYPV